MDQQHSGQSLLDLDVDPQVSRSFREASRWAKFIGIIWAICLGFIVLIAALGGAAFVDGFTSAVESYESPIGDLIGRMFFVVMGLIVIVGGILLFFLFKFCSQTKAGLERQDQSLFNNGLKSLKNYFMIYGIIALLWFLVILAGFVMGLFTQNV
jgi:hypothetical protein